MALVRMSKFTPAFKAKVAIEAIKEKETIESLEKRYELSLSKITELSEITDPENLRPAGMSRNKLCKYMKFNHSVFNDIAAEMYDRNDEISNFFINLAAMLQPNHLMLK